MVNQWSVKLYPQANDNETKHFYQIFYLWFTQARFIFRIFIRNESLFTNAGTFSLELFDSIISLVQELLYV